MKLEIEIPDPLFKKDDQVVCVASIFANCTGVSGAVYGVIFTEADIHADGAITHGYWVYIVQDSEGWMYTFGGSELELVPELQE